MGLRELLKTPVKDMLKVSSRSSARVLYLVAAGIIALSAACDVLPTSATVRDMSQRSQAFSQADACLQTRVGELGAFEKRRAQLLKDLRPYVNDDASSQYFRNEYTQRVRFSDVAFVHSNPPNATNGLPSPGATPTPDPLAGPTHGPTPDPIVVRTVAKAAQCLSALVASSPPPQGPPGSAVSSPAPALRAFRGRQFELELRGGTQDTLTVNGALSSTDAAISDSDLDFQVISQDRKRLLSSRALVGLYRVVLPTPVPSYTPATPAPTLSTTTSSSGSATSTPAVSPTATPSPATGAQ